MNYREWAQRHPQAAAELAQITAEHEAIEPAGLVPKDEAYAQQKARFAIAKAGGLSWRNNVGATPARIEAHCPKCAFHFEIRRQPVRYGLANDSQRLNEVVKSSDLIGIMPRLITPDMVGAVLGQFVAVETKPPGWQFKGNAHETAQQSFLSAVLAKGGCALFSTGAVTL